MSDCHVLFGRAGADLLRSTHLLVGVVRAVADVEVTQPLVEGGTLGLVLRGVDAAPCSLCAAYSVAPRSTLWHTPNSGTKPTPLTLKPTLNQRPPSPHLLPWS